MSNAEEDEGVAAKQRRSGPTGSSALLKALIGLSVAGLIYGMFFYRTPIGPPPTVPGWDGLVACSYMGSLDGSKQLVLSEKNTVTYFDNALGSGNDKKISGFEVRGHSMPYPNSTP
jgi:hypothetical protein